MLRYAVATAWAKIDRALLLLGAIAAPRPKNLTAILDPKRAGELLRVIDGYSGQPATPHPLRPAALPARLRAPRRAMVGQTICESGGVHDLAQQATVDRRRRPEHHVGIDIVDAQPRGAGLGLGMPGSMQTRSPTDR